MIFAYHRIRIRKKDNITIHPIMFLWQMFCLVNKRVVFLDDYNPLDKENVVLTFDDGYRDFLRYALPILRFFKYPFELAIIADKVGVKGYLNANDLKYIVKCGGRLQFHTLSHVDLSLLDTEDEIIREITVPEDLKTLDEKGFKFLIYPHWNYNERVIDCVKRQNFKGALSGNQLGSDNIYCLNRIKIG